MTSADVWNSFINHNHIKDDETFKKFMPQVLSACRERFMRVRCKRRNELMFGGWDKEGTLDLSRTLLQFIL